MQQQRYKIYGELHFARKQILISITKKKTKKKFEEGNY